MRERMMVSILREFIDNDKDCYIAILVGIRKIGKTTILDQLKEYYEKYGAVTKINFEEATAWDQYLEFKKTDSQILLLDEVTHIKDYEDVIRAVEYDVHNGKKQRFKVVITGSSYTHLRALHGSVLGGGRSKLFKLPVLSFTEYLNFTNDNFPKDNYDTETILQKYSHDSQDFFDYLRADKLEELGASGLKLTLNQDYLRTMYDDIAKSNDNCILSSSDITITEGDILSIGNMIAYTLSELVTHNTFTSKKGDRELRNIGKFDSSILDRAEINVSIKNYSSILPVERRAVVLKFLLQCNLAYVEFQYERRTEYSLNQLLTDLNQLTKKQDFADIIENYNICIINPSLYTRLGEEILSLYGADPETIYKGYIKGLILENYLKGAYCLAQYRTYMEIYRLGGNKVEKDLSITALKSTEIYAPEVDLLDEDRGIMIEIATFDKGRSEVNLRRYFKDRSMIRILASNEEDDSPPINKLGYHRIPFTKLIILIETGKVFELERTLISETI